MPDWLAILKDYVDSLETIVGTEGGVALANKLTAARAAYLANINNAQLLNEPHLSPLPSLCEAWLESSLDTTLWTIVNPATGLAWSIATHTTGHRVIWSRPNLSENCQLYANFPQLVCPVALQTDSIVRKAIIEFEMKLSNVANINNVSFFVGIGPGASTRISDYIIGWGLAADVLVSVTDDAGIETTNTGFGETLTNFNKLRVELTYGHAKFFINEVQVADHITNLPNLANLFTLYLATEAGGNASIYLGTVRAWMEDIVR